MDASLDVERRSIFTTIVVVIIAALLTVAADAGTPPGDVFRTAVVVVAATAVARLLLFARARRLPPGSVPRLRIMFVPLFAHVAAWSAFAAWGVVVARGTGLSTVIVSTQCLCSAAVVMSYAGMPRLAVAIIGVTIVPTACAVIVDDVGLGRAMGLGALMFCAMLISYVPRVARERRAAVASMLLLTERARSLEEARDAALAAAAVKDDVFANLSHEIRTPLNGLLGTVQRLKAMPLDDDQRAAVEQLQRCGRRLLGTLNDALDSARLESGRLELRREPLVLPDLVREVIELYVDEARAKGLVLTLEQDVLRDVVGDDARLRQVLQNLISNAIKFTDGGTVKVSARTVPTGADVAELTLDVVDTGVGFDEEDRARLFRRFSRLRGDERKTGAGLGLAISAELVKLMSGSLHAESPGVGRGASFRARIPVRVRNGSPTAIAGLRVLVVDDDALNLTVMRAYLEALGVVVDVVSDGRDALARAASVRYDAILMDCHMPVLDGFAATRALRARGDTTPVLAVTAADDEATKQRCRDVGMQAFLEKPVSSDALREAVARAVSQEQRRS